MEYNIYPSQCGKYIILSVWGEINQKTAMQQNKEAHKLGEELGINRYLVDVRKARNTDSVIEKYNFAYNDMQHTEGINKRAKVVFVSAPEDNSHDFIETVSRNAGLNVTIFKDIEEAKRFLLLQ